MRVLFPLLLVAWTFVARAEPAATYRQWLVDGETVCAAMMGEKLKKPDVWKKGKFTYAVAGARAKITGRAGQGAFKIGVIGPLFDDENETVANLVDYLKVFRTERVDLVVVSGGTGATGAEIERNLGRIASLGVPVVALIGNTENRGTFNIGLRDAHEKHRNVLHGGFVRSIDFDGLRLVTLPGYHDEARLMLSGACLSRPNSVKELEVLAAGAPHPVLLLAQDTPLFKGSSGLDYMPGSGHLGDPALNRHMKKADIRFGVFTTAAESGGRATDVAGNDVKQKAWSDSLWLNPGAANSLPTRVHGVGTSYGMAAFITLEDGRAKWERLRSPQRVGKTRRVRTR